MIMAGLVTSLARLRVVPICGGRANFWKLVTLNCLNNPVTPEQGGTGPRLVSPAAGGEKKKWNLLYFGLRKCILLDSG